MPAFWTAALCLGAILAGPAAVCAAAEKSVEPKAPALTVTPEDHDSRKTLREMRSKGLHVVCMGSLRTQAEAPVVPPAMRRRPIGGVELVQAMAT